MPAFNADGLALLKQCEGCRLTSYIDQAGVWTIGYGHTGHEIVPGLAWTQDQADAVLNNDIQIFAAGVLNLITNPDVLNDNQFSAVVIFAFNIGLAAFAGSTALRELNSGNTDNLPTDMLMWDKIHDPHTGQLVVNQGLLNRRNAEIGLWNTPMGR
jgi:lysozyme